MRFVNAFFCGCLASLFASTCWVCVLLFASLVGCAARQEPNPDQANVPRANRNLLVSTMAPGDSGWVRQFDVIADENGKCWLYAEGDVEMAKSASKDVLIHKMELGYVVYLPKGGTMRTIKDPGNRFWKPVYKLNFKDIDEKPKKE